MEIGYEVLSLPLLAPFAISRTIFHEAKVVRVKIGDGSACGVAECVPQARFGESVASVIRQLDFAAREAVLSPLNREQIQLMLPAGAARNAIDCALWDLEAKRDATPVWKIAGIEKPVPVVTAYTLPLNAPEDLKRLLELNRNRPLLKVKVGSPEDATRLRQIRKGAPLSRLIVDANEGWSIDSLDAIAPMLADLRVEMVEQPLPAENDEALRGKSYPFAVCADESCRGSSSIPSLVGKYNSLSIKLDKVGGLTEALALRSAAARAGLLVMVGCGIGSSLAIAPAVLVAQGATFVDLDGPLFLREDVVGGIRYSGNMVAPADPAIWG